MSGTEPAGPSRGADSLMASAVRRSIVERLRALPPLAVSGRPTRDTGLTAAELGQELGLHSTTVRFHLDQLVDGGLVDTHVLRSGGAGRPAKRYVASAEAQAVPEPAIEGPFQVLATVLASALDPTQGESPTPEEAGAQWVRRRLGVDGTEPLAEPARTTGEWVGKVGSVVDLLQEWGYTPDLEMSGRHGDVRITLRDCPFLDLARESPEVVCGVHRGLLKGALEVAGEDAAGVSLRPFVAHATCHALLLRDRTPPGEPIEPGPARWGSSQHAVPADDPETPTDTPATTPGDPA